MKAKKLVCTKSVNSFVNVWNFTEGKEYKLHGRWSNDPHVFDDNGQALWLFRYPGVIRGAGIDEFHFREVD